MEEESIPGVIMANSPSNRSMVQASIPHNKHQSSLSFSLTGDGILLNDPTFKVNQSKAATLILE